ncbi:type IV pilin-like G/H family protein [Microcystis aeruginosa]|uniref:type IV pilin-like G/H family protein n=1 Tax=Microcystis aeruginosa TaxID=1126 RepID=UPI00187EF60F|nr:type IV pilin-like G/H family protein [Microcystis aeruginosa]MBE8996463.1 prepilin-type N-terminal cleavage/methylation domain-containing protein [Microcystis aeruginosa LEGE 91341]
MKYLLFLAIKSQGKKARGFTLIELLVVVVILGVLAAVGLPNLLGQVAKSRQAEAIAILGQINRAQQAYRYENGIFASVNNPNQLPINGINNARFYTFTDHFAPTITQSSYRADATRFNNDIKNYAGGVGLRPDGRLFPVICEDENALQDDVFVNTSGGCTNGITLNDLSGVQQVSPLP